MSWFNRSYTLTWPVILLVGVVAYVLFKGLKQYQGDERCSGLDDCQSFGKCAWKDGECVVGSDEDCEASLGCKVRGLCTARDGKCIAASAADCNRSTRCRDHGMCALRGESCTWSK